MLFISVNSHRKFFHFQLSSSISLPQNSPRNLIYVPKAIYKMFNILNFMEKIKLFIYSKIVQCWIQINLILCYSNVPYLGCRFFFYIRHCYLQRNKTSICKQFAFTRTEHETKTWGQVEVEEQKKIEMTWKSISWELPASTFVNKLRFRAKGQKSYGKTEEEMERSIHDVGAG